MIDGVQHLMRGQTRRTLIVVIVIINDGILINDNGGDMLMCCGRLLDAVMLNFMRKLGATETPYADVRHEDDEH